MEQEKKTPLSELMKTTMEHVKAMADANAIIGTPIQAEGVTLIPVSRMSFGVAGGGSEFSPKNRTENSFGGGSGASAKLEPVAFLPEVVDKVSGFIESQQEKKAKKAAEGNFAD